MRDPRVDDLAAEAELPARAGRLTPHMQVVLPEGRGPFPVVVQMHGCGGLQPFQARYAQCARAVGVAAVVVDSLAPRRIGKREAQLTVCTGLRLRGLERSIDLLAVLGWLDTQPWADTGRVAAAGWSHGGWAVMEALVGPAPGSGSRRRIAALRGVVLVYPYAGPLTRTAALGWGDNRPDVHACLAGRDAVVGRAGPLRALDRLSADGLKVNLLQLDDATHAFDDDEADDPRTRFRADLTRRAQAFYTCALQASLFR